MEPKPAKAIKWWEGAPSPFQLWQKKFPYLEQAALQLVAPHLEQSALRWHLYPVLKHGSDDVRDKVREKYFKPPATPEEKTIIALADLVFVLTSPENALPGLIDNAIDEIDEAYDVLKQEGGGWSSDASKSNPKKRKEALSTWFKREQGRLLYLRELYLTDERLYEDRGGQEKRDFRDILLIMIIEDLVKQKLSSHEIRRRIKDLKR